MPWRGVVIGRDVSATATGTGGGESRPAGEQVSFRLRNVSFRTEKCQFDSPAGEKVSGGEACLLQQATPPDINHTLTIRTVIVV